MRDRAGRVILAVLGLAAVVAGVLGLTGVLHLETRTATVLVGVGGLGNGLMMVRVALDRSRKTSA